MAERVIVKQDSQFRTRFLAADPEDSTSDEYEEVADIHQLTPYGMLLSSLASCTALVLRTFAQHHDLALDSVELHMSYDRVFRDDCENIEEGQDYCEEISEKILLKGDLSQDERDKLLRIAHRCPVYEMLKPGITISTILMEGKIES